MVRFTRKLNDCLTIRKIAARAVERAARHGIVLDPLDIEMDVSATHANGCRLDLQKLLDFDVVNFAHDISGIRRHLDRDTGKLQDHFLPRCIARRMQKRQRSTSTAQPAAH